MHLPAVSDAGYWSTDALLQRQGPGKFVCPLVHQFFYNQLYKSFTSPNLSTYRTGSMKRKLMSQFLTDTHDLRELVSNCKACSNSLLHGRNILHHEHLANLQLQHCKKLCAFIINTKLPSESYGHWICLLRFRNVFVMIDGLNYAIKRPDIMRNVKRFCHLNNCILNVMHLRCQEKSSFKCGYIALAVIAKYHTMSVKQFYNLQTVFKRNSIKFNENLLLEFAQKHFAFSL